MKKFAHKKSLGQNFLINKEIIASIAEGAHVTDEDIVVEVGPGQGSLTADLATRAKKVIAVEIDERLIPELEKRFASTDNVEIVHGDILQMNISDILGEGDHEYKVVANIPYYITAPIIRIFLESSVPPKEIVLMIQKEVAERLCAEPGKLSILGIAAQYYADVSYLFTVDRSEFDPVPGVDSAVVNLAIKENLSSVEQRKQFFRTVKIGFSAKRKTLLNNIASGFHREKTDVEKILQECDISLRARAQEIDIATWQDLAIALEKK